MNKLLGFYELKELRIPTIPWKKFTPQTRLSNDLLWTVRMALEEGDDWNLPRFIGVSSVEAEAKGNELLRQVGEFGLVIYYPYFIAEKSGVLEVKKDTTIIEACQQDLWNLVTKGIREVTLTFEGTEVTISGNSLFLSNEEVRELLRHALCVKNKYRDFINEGKSLLLEWSYAFSSDKNKKAVGERYLVFYELRTVD